MSAMTAFDEKNWILDSLDSFAALIVVVGPKPKAEKLFWAQTNESWDRPWWCERHAWHRIVFSILSISLGSNPYTVISFSLVSHDNNWNISWRALPQKLLHYFVKVCQFYDFYARMPKSMSRNDSCFLVDCMNCHSSTWPLSHLTILIWSDEITVIQLNFLFFEFFSPGHFSWLGWLG